MTTKEMIEVMQAYEDGKTIELTYKGADIWNEIEVPSWNWDRFDYRVKPEKRYRPYRNKEEMIADWKDRYNRPWYEISMPLIWVLSKVTDTRMLVTAFNEYSVAFDGAGVDFRDLLSYYTYLDGSPCGKEVTE